MIEHSDSINELAAALSKAQGNITGAIKDSKNPFYKSTYADLSSVWDACRTHLAAQGLAVIQINGNEELRITVTTMLVHSSGQWIRGTCSARPAKDDAQATGSVITYLRRYGLAAIVGIAQVDDDANAGVSKLTMVTPDPVDHEKISRAVQWFQNVIDEDQLEINWSAIQAGWAKLSSNEQMAVDNLLGDKAVNSKRMYRTILKDYLNYVPEGIAK